MINLNDNILIIQLIYFSGYSRRQCLNGCIFWLTTLPGKCRSAGWTVNIIYNCTWGYLAKWCSMTNSRDQTSVSCLFDHMPLYFECYNTVAVSQRDALIDYWAEFHVQHNYSNEFAPALQPKTYNNPCSSAGKMFSSAQPRFQTLMNTSLTVFFAALRAIRTSCSTKNLLNVLSMCDSAWLCHAQHEDINSLYFPNFGGYKKWCTTTSI